MPIHGNLSDSVASRDRVLTEVKEIVAEHATIPPEEMREDHRLLEDLGCDSLDIVEITMEIEEQLDVSVPDELAENISTIGDVVDRVLRLLGRSE